MLPRTAGTRRTRLGAQVDFGRTRAKRCVLQDACWAELILLLLTGCSRPSESRMAQPRRDRVDQSSSRARTPAVLTPPAIAEQPLIRTIHEWG
jgi:hypothetical protein